MAINPLFSLDNSVLCLQMGKWRDSVCLAHINAYHGIPLFETGMQHLVSQRGSQLEAFDCSLWYVFSTPWLEYLLCDVV